MTWKRATCKQKYCSFLNQPLLSKGFDDDCVYFCPECGEPMAIEEVQAKVIVGIAKIEYYETVIHNGKRRIKAKI